MKQWPTMPLRRVVRVVNGGTPTPDEANWGGDVPWATPVDIGAANGEIAVTQRTLTHAGVVSGSHIVPAGSILISTRAPIGYVATTARAMAFNQGCKGLVPGGLVDTHFLYYQLSALTTELSRRGQGTTFLELSAENLASMDVVIPTLDEQQRIADFLDAETARIDETVALRFRQLDLLLERRRAVLHSLATTGGEEEVRQTSSQWIPTCGVNWSVEPLKRRWTVVDCKHRTPSYVSSGYPVISPGDIRPGRLDLSTATRFVGEDDFLDLADSQRRPLRGDIVYSRNASVGIASYVDTDEPFTMGQDVCRITSSDQSQLFLSYFLNVVAIAELGSLQVGSTFTRVNIATLLNLSIACPPPDVQRRLAIRMDAVAEEYRRVEEILQKQLDLLAERKQALITAAVTGQFDVTTARGADLS